jgi:hypothetical protein
MEKENRREILFEGLTETEILNFPREHLESLVLTGEPLVFRIGSAAILGEFKVAQRCLSIELAQIEEGGEGVLLALGSLARRFAIVHGLSEIEWIVHAIHCAKPNVKLRRVLVRRGFIVQNVAGIGEAYYFRDRIDRD